jgi:hypothetical protein
MESPEKKVEVNRKNDIRLWERLTGKALIPLMLMGSLAAAACEEVDLPVPDSAQVEAAYLYGNGLTAFINGNVAEITIVQSTRDLQRGGTLWAKVGPYVLLFSDETEQLFRDFPGLAAVRAVTVTRGGTEVARALLSRDELSDITWRRAKNIAGLARRDGTRRPSLLEDLVEWGEDHTTYEYDPQFTRP